jgi:hypothetical protein
MAKSATAPMMDKAWQAESDLRTLIDAEKIKKDKTRYAAAMKCHAEQMKALAAIGAEKKA